MFASSETEVLLEAVIRSVDAPLCLLSDAGIVLSANEVWLESMQLTAGTAIGAALHLVASERASVISEASARNSSEPIRLPPRPRLGGGVWEETLRRIETADRVVFLLSARASVESTGDAVALPSAAVDVRSIRASETALRRSENHLRQLIEHTPAGVALFDREMRYLAVSRRWASDYGFDYDSLLGRSHYEVFPEIPQRWREIHQRCLAGATERCDEDPFVRADGRLEWVEWEIQPWRNPDGTIGGLILFAVAITERKQAADRLLATKERLAVTLSSIGDAVIATDESSRITLLNRAAEQLTGWSAADALGTPLDEVFRIVNEDTGERTPSPAQRALREGVLVKLANRTDLIARNGDRRPIADSTAPIRDTQGRIVGAVLVFRDQTSIRTAEVELKRSRAELSSLIEQLPIGVFVCEHDAIVYANPAFAEYCGRLPSELIGRRLSELAAHGKQGPPEDGEEWEVLTPNDRSATLTCSPMRTIAFDGRQAHLWTCRDLSPLKQIQAQLIHKDRLATVGMLAAGVAHEINNPLAYLLIALEVIDEKLHRMAALVPESELAQAFELLRDARLGAERVKAIVSDLKTFSRGDSEERIPLDLKRSLESAIALATNEIKQRARIVCEFDSAPCVVGNEARLGQVFLNLLVNAAHSIPEGHPEDNEIHVVLTTDRYGRAAVEVVDTGMGLSPEALDRLFIPFFTTKVGSGTGLGLAISRNTVSALGGEITLKNRAEGGAIARVVLPAGEVDHPRHGAARSNDGSGPHRARVMIVDDEAAICSTFERLLEGEHDVTTETSAREAWTRIERGERFDVVFCDVMMPGMSGMELHQRLQSEAPEQAARIVFMTGGTFTQSATEYLDRAPNLRLDKPCSVREIRQLVVQVVQGPAAEGLATGDSPLS